MKNSTAHKVAQTIVFIICLVWASMLITSCSTTKGSTYQNHLKSKRTGAHQLHNGNGGCNWNK